MLYVSINNIVLSRVVLVPQSVLSQWMAASFSAQMSAGSDKPGWLDEALNFMAK